MYRVLQCSAFVAFTSSFCCKASGNPEVATTTTVPKFIIFKKTVL